MLSVRNEYETVAAFTTIAGCSTGTQTPRETAIELLQAVETTTGIHARSVDRMYKELSACTDEDTQTMFEIQEECAELLNESMPIPEFCSVTLQDNEWIVIPYLDNELERVSDVPEEYSGDHVLYVNDHGNVTCMEWDPGCRAYSPIWDMV